MKTTDVARKIPAIVLSAASFICAALICTMNHPLRDTGETDHAHNGTSGAMNALEFWSASRAYPEPDIPHATYFKEFQRATKEAKMSHPFPDAITSWRSIGPNNLCGRALSIAVTPQNRNTIYVGSAAGGLWRSHTAGLAGDWERVATGYPVLGVSAIAVDPTDSNTLYIGTGEVYRPGIALGGLVVRTTRGSFGMGILKTTDYGATWSKSLDWSLDQQQGIQAVKLNPLNPHTVYAATTIGFYRSRDAGGSWEAVLQYPMAEDFLVNPLDTNQIIVSTGNFKYGAGVHRTSDGGTTWNDVTALPDFSGKTMLEEFGADPRVVFADVADSTTGVGSLWKSTDFGLTWSQLNADQLIYDVQGWYSHFVTVHPADVNQIFHAAAGWRKSTDGGLSFHGAGSGDYSDHHSFAHDPLDPNILYVVNDDGPYRSTDFGETFSSIGTNLTTGQFYNGFSNSSTDSLLAIGQVQDHIPGYRYTGSTTWGRSAVDEVGWTAIDQTNDNIMYALRREGFGLSKSTDRGVTWQFAGNVGPPAAWNSPLVASPSQPNIIYAGKTNVWKSTDAGATFAATNGNADLDGNPAISLALSATSPDTLFVGLAPLVTRGEVFRTTDGGTSWTNVTGTLPDRYPLDLAFDPKDSRTAYATFGGFGSGHVFKTTNTGASWSDISGTLPDVPTGAVLVDPSNSNDVYVGDDISVYVSTNAGASWAPFDEGLPEALLVSDLSYTPSNHTLRLATHGNGVFERKVENTLPALTLLTPHTGDSVEAGSHYHITWGSGLVHAVRIEYSGDNGAHWVALADSVPAAVSTLLWTPPFDLTSHARIRVTAIENPALSDQTSPSFTIFYDGIVRPMSNGWNLVSMPVVPPDPRAGIMFPAHSASMYDYTSGAYRKRDSLDAYHGYWAKYIGAQGNGLKGSPVTSLTVTVDAGWNLIGSLSVPISAANIASDPPGNVLSRFFFYDGSKYVEADSILPGYGYWVRTAGPGTITLSPSAIAAKQEAAPPVPPNTLSFIDEEGHSRTLYLSLGGSGDPVRMYALPPVPPLDAFDIRFASNSAVEAVRSGESKFSGILLQGVAFPLSVSWDFRDAGLTMVLTAGRKSLAGAGSLVVNGAPDGQLAFSLSGDETPRAFALYQNFPNPFNPVTEIRYELAGRARVTLKMYDILGKEVATLVDKEEDPGAYNARWDAQSMPSGVYVYRLSAGSYTTSRKLLLIK